MILRDPYYLSEANLYRTFFKFCVVIRAILQIYKYNKFLLQMYFSGVNCAKSKTVQKCQIAEKTKSSKELGSNDYHFCVVCQISKNAIYHHYIMITSQRRKMRPSFHVSHGFFDCRTFIRVHSTTSAHFTSPLRLPSKKSISV